MLKKGAIIVLDGIDGSGKTTISKLLLDYLKEHGREVFYLSEPNESSDTGKLIESMLRKRDSNKVKTNKWVELFTKNRKESEKTIKESLNNGKIVILDRYYYSTLAYQLEPINWQAYSEQFIKPDIVFILDVDEKIGIARVKYKYEKTKEKMAYFEKEKILKEVRRKFLAIPQFLKDNIKIIDSSREIKDVWFDIKREVNEIVFGN